MQLSHKMKKKNILYIGRNTEISATILRLINAKENWNALEASNVKDVHKLCIENSVDLILLGCGIEIETEMALRLYIETNFPKTKVVMHYGGGSGLLYNEILLALGN